MRSAGVSIHSSSQGQNLPTNSGAGRPTPSASGCEVMIMVRKNSCASTVETFYLDNVGISYQSTSTQPVLVKAGYPYGFNGQEKDNEVMGEGNSYTAEFWNYDVRLGRRWNVDPKPNPSISSYAVFSNNPIFFIDIEGDTITINLLSKTDILYERAERFVKEQYNDGVFIVFGHSSSMSVSYYDETGNKGKERDANTYLRVLSKKSPAFNDAMESGHPVCLVMFSCNVASKRYISRHTGKEIISPYPIAEKIADGLPNGSVVIAPDGYVLTKRMNGTVKIAGVLSKSEDGTITSNQEGFLKIKKGSQHIGEIRMTYDVKEDRTIISQRKNKP